MGDSVICGACQSENPAGAAFCMTCGAALPRTCPSCGEQSPAEAKFCGACGTALGGPPATGDAPPPGGESDRRASAGETDELPDAEQRRTVTVLFADLSGYTSISERLDHETVKALVERCLTRLATEVERFGGRVDKYIGDNVMAVFGAPLAHEDDPSRAVRAALGMQDGDGRAARGARRAVRHGARAAGGGQHRRGAGGAHRRVATPSSATPSTSRRGCRPPRRSAACSVGERTRRLSAARSPTARRAAHAEGQGRAGAGVGGARRSPSDARLAPAGWSETPLIGREEELVAARGGTGPGGLARARRI